MYAFDRASGRVSQLTRTPENENSPTPLPAGIGEPGGFSVVQSEMRQPDAKPGPIQRLWRFNASGASPQLILADINPVGYHAWIDADRLALFVLGQPNSLQLASVKTGKAEVAANGIGRSLHRIPGTRLVSFVHREASRRVLDQADRHGLEEDRSADEGRRGQQRSRHGVDCPTARPS